MWQHRDRKWQEEGQEPGDRHGKERCVLKPTVSEETGLMKADLSLEPRPISVLFVAAPGARQAGTPQSWHIDRICNSTE